MNFALLGSDDAACELARAVVASPDDRLVWGSNLGAFEAEFRQLAPAAAVTEHWETLLSRQTIEALIVARTLDDDARADQLRKLVQAGLPMILSHPIHSSMLVYYELDMIRRESRAPMLPYLPARWHPAVEQASQLLQQGDAGLGRLEQLVIERQMALRSPAPPGEASDEERTADVAHAKRSVQSQFAVDIDLARLLCGDLNKIGAMAPSGTDERYANLGVQLSGPASTMVRWSVGPVEEFAGAKLTLFATRGKVKLWLPAGEQPASLQLNMPDRTASHEYPATHAAAERAIAHLKRAVQGDEVLPDWTDACRSVELADTLDRSLNKGRTVELYYEDYTEQGTFKGTMTSIGCGLLILSLVLLPVAAIAAKLGVPLAQYWAYFLLAVFVLFLLLQGLHLVFPQKDRDAAP